MTRSQLIAKLSERFNLKLKDTELIVDEILTNIDETLCAGGRVEVRDFGVFTLNNHAARVGRNPLSGEKVYVPAKSFLHFKPSKELKNRVNQNAKYES